MPRVSSLFILPESIRVELIQRRAELKNWTLDDHVEWLAGLGYVVSRSALGRYLADQADSILEAEAQRKEAEQLERVHAQSLIRLRCLEMASRFCETGTKDELLRTANELLGWVQPANTP